MNASVIAVIIVVALIVASTLSIMNRACKSGYHAAPQFPPCGIILKLSGLPDCDCRPETQDVGDDHLSSSSGSLAIFAAIRHASAISSFGLIYINTPHLAFAIIGADGEPRMRRLQWLGLATINWQLLHGRFALNVVRQCGSFASSRISRVVPDALLSVLAAEIRCLRLSI
jgi:hypothetical protein